MLINKILVLGGICIGVPVCAQDVKFDVASVRVADPSEMTTPPPAPGGPGSADPGRATYRSINLRGLLSVAYYGFSSDQIVVPASMSSRRYDINVTMPTTTTREQFRIMLRNLMAERFHMVTHHVTKEFDGYELVVSKQGSRLKPRADGQIPSAPPGISFMGRGKGTEISARAQTITDLVPYLNSLLHFHIVDKTSLTVPYDFTLIFSTDFPGSLPQAGGQGPAEAISPDSPPNIFVALEDQLGLKLEPKKVLLDTIVVDSADQVPTGN